MILSKISLNKILLAISIVIAICFATISLATLNAANTSDPDNYARVKAKLPIVADQEKSEKQTPVNEDNTAADGTTPTHNPVWTDHNVSDPGVTLIDDKHKKWIDVLSMSNSASKDEKAGTEDINIGVGELQEMKGDFTRSQMPIRKKPGRTTYRGTDNNLKLTQPPLTYVCEGGGASDECFCDGVLDCNSLWTSGDCKDGTKWQDSNDSSKGGCVADD